MAPLCIICMLSDKFAFCYHCEPFPPQYLKTNHWFINASLKYTYTWSMKDDVSEKLCKPNKEHVIEQIWKINL